MTTRRLFVWLLMVALFVMSIRETLDPDMWWHLRTGEAILQNGRVPTTDLFSFTVPQNEWIVQQWLTDVLMWQLYEMVGLRGLSVFFALVITASFMLVYKRCVGRPYLGAFVVLLGLLTAALPLGVRPQMFNMLFIALFVHILEGVKDEALRPHFLYLLPLLTVLWANMHSGYLSGIALLGAYTVGEGAQLLLRQDDGRRLSWSGWWRLALMSFLALFAALANPSGYKLWLFPVLTLSSDAIQSNIVEWRSPDFHVVYFWFFGVMAAVGILSWLYSNRRPTWTELFVFFGTAAGGLLSARHIPLFAVATIPIISRHLLSAFEGGRFYTFLAGEQRRTAAPPRLVLITNNILAVLALLFAVVWVSARLENNEAAIAARLPVAAIDYIEETGLADGRVYNNYQWGGYLIWRRIPVFIDGRTELYGNEFFLYYLQTVQLRADWQQPLTEFDIDYVLIEDTHPLGTLLLTSGEWEQAYVDHVAQVLVRK